MTGYLLPALPFVLVVAAYAAASSARLAENPDDKLLPGWSSFMDAIRRVAFLPDRHSGEILLWADTASSLQRLFDGLALSALIAFTTGVAIGMFPYVRSLVGRFIDVVSMVPPLAILPILFISVGLGEASKITLIVIGTAPFALIAEVGLSHAINQYPAQLQAACSSAWHWPRPCSESRACCCSMSRSVRSTPASRAKFIRWCKRCGMKLA